MHEVFTHWTGGGGALGYKLQHNFADKTDVGILQT